MQDRRLKLPTLRMAERSDRLPIFGKAAIRKVDLTIVPVHWRQNRRPRPRRYTCYLVALRALSFTRPAAFWTVPFALSSFPSACIFLLPVAYRRRP